MQRLALTLCLLALPALAQPPRAGRGGLKNELGLTDAQIQQLRELRQSRAREAQPMADQLREKGRALREAMQAEHPDAARVGQLMVEMKALREQARTRRTGLNEQARAVLNADQLAKLKELESGRRFSPAARQARMLGLLGPPEAGQGPGLRRQIRSRVGVKNRN